MAAMNSYMLPQGTRCSASPLVVTAVMCRASPAQVSRKAARSHGPCGHGDRVAPATAGSRRPALPGRNLPLPLPAVSSAAGPPSGRSATTDFLHDLAREFLELNLKPAGRIGPGQATDLHRCSLPVSFGVSGPA